MNKSILKILIPLVFLFSFAVFAYAGGSELNITLSGPPDNNWSIARNVNFTFIPELQTPGAFANCSLWTNYTGTWAITQTNTSSMSIVNASTSWINYTFAADKNAVIWGIRCYNTTTLSNWSNTNRTIYVDATAPSDMSFLSTSQANASWPNRNWILVNISVTEANHNTTNVTAWNSSDGGVTWQAFQVTQFNSTTNMNFNFTGLPDDNITINFTTWDQGWNLNRSVVSRIYYIDTVYPTWTNGTQNDANNTNSIRQWIYYNVSGSDMNEVNVTFSLYYWNGSLKNTTTYTTATRNINWTGLDYGVYKYNATIVDKAGNTNTTVAFIKNLYINLYNGTGGSTDLATITNWASVALKLSGGNSNISWGSVDLTGSSLDFNSYVTLGGDKITVNSTMMPAIGGAANVTFSGLTYTNTPRILKDEAICSDCSNIAYNSTTGILTLLVTGFSTYRLESMDSGGSGSVANGGGGGGGGAPAVAYCGNNICDRTFQGENEQNCPDDCAKPGYSSTYIYQSGGAISGGNSIDTDSDGLSDYDEMNIFYTNPNKADSDSDGINDQRESQMRTTPGKAATGQGKVYQTLGNPLTSGGEDSDSSPMTTWVIVGMIVLAAAGLLYFLVLRKN